MAITPAAFMALPEYSGSMPTGTTPGKTWRREDGIYDPRARNLAWRKANVRWVIVQYQACGEKTAEFPDGKMVRTVYYKPVFRVKAGSRVLV